MLILDTSGLLAAIDSDQRFHAAAREVLSRHEGPLLLSPFVLAELDYLLVTRLTQSGEIALLDEVGRGAYSLEQFSTDGVAEAVTVI